MFNVKMKNKGFTLLEVIIAIVLVLVGITGTFVLITKTMGVMAISSSRLIAAYLSQEGIEIVRNIRDTNWIEQSAGSNSWDEGLTGCSTGCAADYTYTATEDPDLLLVPPESFLKISVTGIYSYNPADTDTKFKRGITIVPNGSDILEVTVLVEWKEKGKTYSHTAQENLYNWK
ncbi:MAG TPA: prepilin-type N-terminal cleavage/methylation domain-containing protein [Candidatus Nealsonbacteria bacterium]|uniref:Type II secretion system protein GspI C-terminal domain-containing protein n=1 Tax=marine sediment metagenome TaxID=412755 RepID=A0A0F9UWE9_9ZZZZ|nr:prepilin-type N-terminal cleavage/methylation domain-containing protein [Candidatus Nealsonbacteria bacterium]HEB46172.1 prepilin-type N-terminal cleavage/methylation domain-containing protein [Candidatus Nealsonbacteria bacterium]